MELSGGCFWCVCGRCSLLLALFLGSSLLLFRFHLTFADDDDVSVNGGIGSVRNIHTTVSGLNRKLLILRHEASNRVGVGVGVGVAGEKCGESDVVINQGATGLLPNGIPSFSVEIMNQCVSGCNISTLHLSCGWFSSATIVNPLLFKRLAYDDCLVNNGRPLPCGATLSFQYASTFSYPLNVASLACS